MPNLNDYRNYIAQKKARSKYCLIEVDTDYNPLLKTDDEVEVYEDIEELIYDYRSRIAHSCQLETAEVDIPDFEWDTKHQKLIVVRGDKYRIYRIDNDEEKYINEVQKYIRNRIEDLRYTITLAQKTIDDITQTFPESFFKEET